MNAIAQQQETKAEATTPEFSSLLAEVVEQATQPADWQRQTAGRGSTRTADTREPYGLD